MNALGAPATDAAVLIVKRILKAPPERVFDAWLTREEWGAWIGPEGIDCDITAFEPRVGGSYRLIMNVSKTETIIVVGVFKTIDRPRGFSFTWRGESVGPETLVTVSLRAVSAGTELTLRHEGLITAENRDSHSWGWNSTLNKLELHLAGAPQ
jgi:glutathione S-transferase